MKSLILFPLVIVPLLLSNCSYLPIPLPQQYKLASEAYVNTQVSEKMAAEMGSYADSIRTEVSAMIQHTVDSLTLAQGEIQKMVAESRSLQAELRSTVKGQAEAVSAHAQKLDEISSILDQLNAVQNELVKNVQNIPYLTLGTLQKALSAYRPVPIRIKRPAPSPKVTAPAAAPSTKPVKQAAEPESTPNQSTNGNELMAPDSSTNNE